MRQETPTSAKLDEDAAVAGLPVIVFVDAHPGGIVLFPVPRGFMALRPFRRSATMSETGGDSPGSEDLIERARRADPQAWTEIYKEFSRSIFGFFYHQLHSRELAEDMTAEVFVEALKAAHRFHGTWSDLRSWLFRIGRNNLIDHRRRQKRAKLEAIEDANPFELHRSVPPEDPQDIAMANLAHERVRAAVEGLSPDQKEVVILRLTAGLSSPEIADIVGKSVGAVKALQHRALGSLAKSLAGEDR